MRSTQCVSIVLSLLCVGDVAAATVQFLTRDCQSLEWITTASADPETVVQSTVLAQSFSVILIGNESVDATFSAPGYFDTHITVFDFTPSPVYVDMCPLPTAPSVAVAERSDPAQPVVWSWTSGGTGDGTFRHGLDEAGPWTETTTTTVTLTLPAGEATLYVQERGLDNASWSSSGSATTLVAEDRHIRMQILDGYVWEEVAQDGFTLPAGESGQSIYVESTADALLQPAPSAGD